MDTPTDRELWEAATAGDAAAFGLLFDRHARTIYNYAFRRLADWAEAEDVVSLVFLEAWRRRGEVTIYEDRVLPWLLGVATNVVRNLRRTQRRHRTALERLPLDRSRDPSELAAERLDDVFLMRRILNDLRRLPPPLLDVIHLCVFSGLSYAEAAVALDIPVGTVRSRLARARSRLRESMTELSSVNGHEMGGRFVARSGPEEPSA